MDSMRALLDSEWGKLEAGVNHKGWVSEEPPGPLWTYSIVPGVPTVWPPGPDLSLLYYVYALGQAPGRLTDGIYVAAPWAGIEVDAYCKRDPRFNLLSNSIKQIGIQGVRPLSKKETAVYNRKEPVEARLGRLTNTPDETGTDVQEIREYYCTWFELNGVIAEEIRPRHDTFFKWLGCT